ncbi:MAG TPA: flagellar filament capping protein FliD [Steroidobacteraceae bacterium]|nr:flagellar filament capping protein FliD [Steroidobacteraceae bacterium]
MATTDATSGTTASTSSASSGILSSLGIGSGLDIGSLVSQLVAAERAPAQARITAQASDVATKISAMATLKSALSTFQSALVTLTTPSDFSAITASSSDESVFTATASPSAVEGDYDVEVSQLAKAQQLVSTATFASGGDTAVGYGTLTLGLGGQSFSVTLDSSSNTLSDIRDAINSASGNPGIKASLIYGTGGTQLVLTSTVTGAANTITVASSGGDGGLAALDYSATAGGNFTVKQSPQDAQMTVAGIAYTGPSNTISNAIDGVTLNLLATNSGSPATLSVGSNTSATATNVQAFVTAYNTLQTTLSQLGDYNSSTQTAGVLLGDSVLSTAYSAITRLSTDPVAGLSGNYTSLAGIGVTTDANGQLQLDSTRLTAAINANPSAVSDIFASKSGVANRLNDYLDTLLGSTGAIAARDANLTESQNEITQETSDLDAQMQTVQARYTAQFTAMDSILSQLNTTASYLDRVFNTSNNSSSSSG